VTVSVVVGRQLGAIIRRLGGTTRYGTATVISSAGFPRTGTVIIATGEKFPDALTASGLAGCLNAPVLLVHRTSIPTETRNELRRLGAKHAIICGGTPAVNDGVRKKLKAMGMSVERLSGKTRYETAVAISQRIQKLTGRASRVYVVPGTTFPDALIISPLAYKQRNPILLSSNSPLHPSTAKRMTAAHYTSAVLVGPELSGQTENGIRGRIASVERWAGSSQYDTAVQVASRACLDKSLSWSYVGIARGDLFPDGLCGGALSGRQGGVILLTPPTVLDAGVVNTLTAHAPDIARCEVYGSDKAITGPVYAQIQQILH
jgi:putative cell wall-binding protein